MNTGQGLAIAAADAHSDAALSGSQFVFAVFLYAVGAPKAASTVNAGVLDNGLTGPHYCGPT